MFLHIIIIVSIHRRGRGVREQDHGRVPGLTRDNAGDDQELRELRGAHDQDGEGEAARAAADLRRALG